MTNDNVLDQYLNQLDKALGPIDIGERSEIILEIKSHVLVAKEKDSTLTTEQILASLGDANSVASRYLLERGLKPLPPSKTPMVKWLTIGVLGSFAMFFVFLVFAMTYFYPLVEVDEVNGKVRLLGGLIRIQEDSDLIAVGEHRFSVGKSEGSVDTTKENINIVKIPFGKGKIQIDTSSNTTLSYKCKGAGVGTKDEFYKIEAGALKFKLDAGGGVKCSILLPQKIRAEINGDAGKIELIQPQSDIEVTLNNGKVEIDPKKGIAYAYDLNVKNGKIAEFESSRQQGAIKIKVSLNNGKIERED